MTHSIFLVSKKFYKQTFKQMSARAISVVVAMKKLTMAILLVATIVSGFLLVGLNNSGAAISNPKPEETKTSHKPTPSTSPLSEILPLANGQAGGNGISGGERNGNSGNGNGVNGAGSNNGNGNGEGPGSGKGSSGNSENGNGGIQGNNGNNGSNSNDENGNGNDSNSSRNGNGNSGEGTNGNSNNGNSNNGNNGNNGSSNGNNGGNGNNGSGNGNENNNETGSGNGSGNNGNGNNGNGDVTNGNGTGDNNGSGDNSNGNDKSEKRDPTKFKVSGYILDASGKGLGGAMIIFNVPQIVPAVYSDYVGYYEIYAPPGTYHINVWPPFDSNFIYFDQPGFTVGADMTKNISLQAGFKVSGYIRDSSGTPISGAVVCLNNFLSGWFSNHAGYYFVSVPAGTYKFDAHPRIGTFASPTPSFPTYYEYNFAVSCDTAKNITVGNPLANPNPRSAAIALSVNESSKIGTTLLAIGKLSEQNGTPIANKTVIMSYSVADSIAWTQVGSSKTDAAGFYSIEWLVPASGTFTLKTEWTGNSEFASVSTTKTLTFEPAQTAAS